MTDLYDYSYSDDFYGMQNPYIYQDKLYYITSSSNNTMCIASIDVNDIKQSDILTPEKIIFPHLQYLKIQFIIMLIKMVKVQYIPLI